MQTHPEATHEEVSPYFPRTARQLTCLVAAVHFACIAPADESDRVGVLATGGALVHDTFTGEAAVTSHVPDVGVGWVEVWDSSSGTAARVDGAALRAGSNLNHAGQAYAAQPAPPTSDQIVEIALAALDTTSGTKPIGIFGRRVDDDNLYYLKILPNPHSAASLQLYRRAGGSDTLLDAVDDTLAPGDVLTLELTDAAKNVYRNGALRLSSTDNDVSASGTWGIFFGGYGASGHLRTTWRIDEFAARASGSGGGGGGGEDEPCDDSVCGDGTCDPDEDCASCAADCGACPATCGDGACDPGESCGSCPADCGPCPTSGALWISPSEIMALPTSGSAWQNLLSAASRDTSSPNISNQDDKTDTDTLAKALVYARTGDASLRAEVVATLMAAMGTENGGRTLALGRNLLGYVVAADLVGLSGAEDAAFRAWLDGVRTKVLDGRTLISTHEDRPNNWGTHAGASRIAAALYLGDAADLAKAIQVFRGYLGDRSAYAGLKYGDLSWQCNASAPVGINPLGCTKNGHSIDGVLPDDQRRCGGFSWPPCKTNYAWEGLQGAVVQAELLHRHGHAAWDWENRALLRAVSWLHQTTFADGKTFPAEGDDRWIVWIINKRYGTSFPAPSPTAPGKNMGYTDWTHQ